MLFFAFGWFNDTKCQNNLVSNPSFEVYTVCPTYSFHNPPPPPWYIPTNSNDTYFDSCANGTNVGVPYNITKYPSFQYARTGGAYIYLDYENGGDRTYIQEKLLDSLKNGHLYYAEHFVNIPNPLKYACNNIGMLFTKNAVYVDTIAHQYGVLNAKPQIVNYGNPVLGDTVNWLKVSGVFKAQGGEKYLTLGNFKNYVQTAMQQIQPTGYLGAGYYIDDISVIPLDSFCLKADAGRDTAIAQGDSVFIGSLTNGIDSLKWFNGNTVIDSLRPGFWVHPTVTTSYILQQIVNGCFSADTVKVTVGTVPLKMLSYELRMLNDKQIENKWVTANEVNVSHFNIQRSTNNKDFITIGKVSANNKSYNEYSFYYSPTVEGSGVVYYRIESVDMDGKKQFSETRTLNLKPETLNGLSLYPNPAKEQVTIECKSAKELMMIDYLGREVYRSTVDSRPLTVNTKQFSKGIYVVKAIMANGDIKTEKLVVD